MQLPPKRRRLASAAVEEIRFDPAARQEYLAGFHKRKLQRVKQAHEAAEKKARLERIEERRKLREERKADLERHVEGINTFLRPLQHLESGEESQSETESAEANSWEGISGDAKGDGEAEYIDEDRYTTVTIEALHVSREGLHKAGDDDGQDHDAAGRNRQGRGGRAANEGDNMDRQPKWVGGKPKDRPDRPRKKTTKKFRYESKGERKLARVKQKMRSSKRASARRTA